MQMQVFFSETRRQKCQPAGEAGSLASLNEYFGNLPLPADRRSSWENPKLGSIMELLEVPLRKKASYILSKSNLSGLQV